MQNLPLGRRFIGGASTPVKKLRVPDFTYLHLTDFLAIGSAAGKNLL